MTTAKEKTEAVAVAKIEKNIADSVLERVNSFKETKQLVFPKDYSPENALKSAYLILTETKNRDGKLVLDVCTKESVANALFKMVVLGLNPLKKQCNFIAYGNTLSCDMEYAGNVALAKRYSNLKSIKGIAVTQGEEFEFATDPLTGRKTIVKHKQTLDSIGNPNIAGAYAVMEFEDGTTDTEIMNFKQIQAAWNQGSMKGNSPAHKNFPDQMSIKTVINRACKLLVRTSDDSILFDEDDEPKNEVTENVKQEINNNANKKPITIEDAETIETVETNEDVKNEVQEEKATTSTELTEEEKAEIAKEEADLFSAQKIGKGPF